MSSLSVCMIVKNEEDILEKSIQSILPVADELIIADSGSTDSTKKIAAKYTSKIFDFEWTDDFAAAVNFVVEKATSEYICKWDGDFVLAQQSLPKLKQLKDNNFQGADLLYFRWNNNLADKQFFNTKSFCYFIHAKNKFVWHSPIHVYPKAVVSNPTTVIIPEIEVNHFKDPVKKDYRYAQTLRIIRQVMDTTDVENKLRLQPFFAESLMKAEQYEEASNVYKYLLHRTSPADKQKICDYISKLVFCFLKLNQIHEALNLVESNFEKLSNEPVFFLAYADVKSLFDTMEGIKYYNKYLSFEYNESIGLEAFDYERFCIHPHTMLAELYKATSNIAKAEFHYKIVIQKSHSAKVKKQAEFFITKLK